jgi:penicillin-binding protein 1A
LFATVVLLGASVLSFLYFKAHKEAEDAMGDLQKRIDSVNKLTTKMLSKDGEVLFSVSTENRLPLKLAQIPKFVQNAVIAAEDKRFYKHTGVDLPSIFRVIFVDVRGRRLSQGGSTITMQLVKLLFNGSARTLKRKMNDIAFAQVLEQRLPKDRILELYLNKVFFGEGAYGIGEAARIYFNKNIDELTIGEAAMLARCIRRPSVENPIRDLKAATANRDVVLGIMREEAMITDTQYETAVAEKPKVNPKPVNNGVFVKPGAEYFVDHVMAYVEKDLGLDLKNGGFTIDTTLDYGLQKHTLSVLRDFVRENRRDLRINQAAFMVMDSDGNILAEVGGLNYREHHTNLVTTLGGLQPGSGFKPILYATALKAGVINMDSMLSNAPYTQVDSSTGVVYSPRNASKSENQKYYSLREALASSINLCAIHTIVEVGPEAVVQTAYENFGFRSTLAAYPPLALGASFVSPIEMAEAYSVFMLHGDRVRPKPVVRVTDPDGVVVKEYEAQKFPGAFDAGVAGEVDELLRGVVEHGTGREALVVPNARGKTGTTNDAKDAWFTGYADGVLGVGWVGHEVKSHGNWVRAEMNPAVYGGNTSAKIWAAVMGVAHDRYAKALGTFPTESKIRVKPKDQEPGVDVDPDLVAPPDAKGNGDEAGMTDTATGDPIVSTTPAKPEPARLTGPATPPARPDPDGPGKKPGRNGAGEGGNGDVTPPAPDRPKRPAKRDDESQPETVTVEICQDSGLLANPYCPETVTRTFKRGKEPKRKCRIHGPGG